MMLRYKLFVWFKWVSSSSNYLADKLSRFEFVQFKDYCAIFDIQIDDRMTQTIPFKPTELDESPLKQFYDNYITHNIA